MGKQRSLVLKNREICRTLGKISRRSHVARFVPRGSAIFLVLFIAWLSSPSVDRSCHASIRPYLDLGVATDSAGPDQSAAQSDRQEEHGISRKAEEVVRLFGFPITNSMIVTWAAVALALIVWARMATRKYEIGADGRAKFMGMGGRRLAEFSGGNYWPSVGGSNLLVFCDHSHFHRCYKLGEPYFPAWAQSVGAIGRLTGSRLTNHCFAAVMPTLI